MYVGTCTYGCPEWCYDTLLSFSRTIQDGCHGVVIADFQSGPIFMKFCTNSSISAYSVDVVYTLLKNQILLWQPSSISLFDLKNLFDQTKFNRGMVI